MASERAEWIQRRRSIRVRVLFPSLNALTSLMLFGDLRCLACCSQSGLDYYRRGSDGCANLAVTHSTAGPYCQILGRILIFAAQMAFSGWWLARYRFGPAEWAWRMLTYGQVQRMREPVCLE